MLTNFKWYRRLKGGTWYLVSYTYKIDTGMTRIRKEHWINNNLFYYSRFDNFNLIKTENYEK